MSEHIVTETKACTKCGEIKPLSEFHTYRRTNPQGEEVVKRRPACKACDNAQVSKQANTPHGRAVHLWNSMLYRCRTDPTYANVEVRISRKQFIAWVIPELEAWFATTPEETVTLDRTNTLGHYESGNLRLVTRAVNGANTRDNHVVNAPDGMAWCSDCQAYLPAADFSTCSGRSNGLATYCKACFGRRCAASRKRKKAGVKAPLGRTPHPPKQATDTQLNKQPVPLLPDEPEAPLVLPAVKVCRKCHVEKPVSDFYKTNRVPVTAANAGCLSYCKVCINEQRAAYCSTPNGKAHCAYTAMRHRAGKAPGYEHVEVRLTQAEFLFWATPKYAQWAVEHPDETPSIDRIDSTKHYSLDNIRMISQPDNAAVKSTSYVNHAPEGMAWCSSCRQYLDCVLFSSNKARKNGLSTYCKACTSKWHAAHKQKASNQT